MFALRLNWSNLTKVTSRRERLSQMTMNIRSNQLIFVALIAFGIIVTAPFAQADNNQPIAIFPYPESGVVIGQGWDSFNERGTSASCVNVKAVSLERATYATDVRQVLSTYSLTKTSTMSVSIAASGFGASGGGNMSSSNSFRVRTILGLLAMYTSILYSVGVRLVILTSSGLYCSFCAYQLLRFAII